jgi:hypothetical protein
MENIDGHDAWLNGYYPTELSFEQVEALVTAMPSNIDIGLVLSVASAIKDVTSASDQGRDLLCRWATALEEGNREEAVGSWLRFQKPPQPQRGTVTLCKLVDESGNDYISVLSGSEVGFALADYTVEARSNATALDCFSLRDHLEELEEGAEAQTKILGGLALTGQATVFYAAPNCGKTLITLNGLIGSILDGGIDPERLYYINADDGYAGLIEKLALAEEFGFHMLGEGFRGFSAATFRLVLSEMVQKNQCMGVVVVLDTAKKFVDPMSKSESTEFMRLVRRFVVRGGTMILLAHVNKKPGPDGSPIYAGTSDLLEDADCAHTLQVISDPDAKERRVLVRAIKRRGDVLQQAVYTYSGENGISYADLVSSVRDIPEEEVGSVVAAEKSRTDLQLITAAEACIRDGICQKMKLAAAIAEKTGVSRRTALKVLEDYTGTDPGRHRWRVVVRERGAKVFSLITDGSAAPEIGQ